MHCKLCLTVNAMELVHMLKPPVPIRSKCILTKKHTPITAKESVCTDVEELLRYCTK